MNPRSKAREEARRRLAQAMVVEHHPAVVDPAPVRTTRTQRTDQPDRTGSGYPSMILPHLTPRPRERKRLLLGVTTWNRREYIERLVETFDVTRNRAHEWILVVADDGSTDSTCSYLDGLTIDDCSVIVIRNKARSIAGQTNSILATSVLLDVDLGFKLDDDVFFVGTGWDDLYLSATQDSGFDHLVYHNEDWKPGTFDIQRDGLRSRVAANDVMGCLYTFTPALIERVGYLDEVNFKMRGHAHIDWTRRACRASFNDAENVWDAAGSHDLIDMWQRDEYVSNVDWDSDEVKSVLNASERARRMSLIAREDRLFVEQATAMPAPEPPAITIRPPDEQASIALAAAGVGEHWPLTSLVDHAYVLNLDADVDKWTHTAGLLSRSSIPFSRFRGTDGNERENLAEWKAYSAQGFTNDLERRINRKLIQSSGAWGYLKTMHEVISHAKSTRMRRIAVFDDDIMVHRDWAEGLAEVAGAIPDDALVVYLGNSMMDDAKPERVNQMFYHPQGGANGSYAVIIDHRAFDELLDEIGRFAAPFDAGPLQNLDRRHPGRVIALNEPLVIPDVTESLIRAPRDMEDFAQRFGWNLDRYERRLTPDASDRVTVVVLGIESGAKAAVTLRSLRRQWHSNLEIIAVNPGNDQRTLDMLLALRSRDTRIRVFSTPEASYTDAINLLVRQSTSAWTSFVHAGTLFGPTHYSSLLDDREASGADVAGARRRDPWNRNASSVSTFASAVLPAADVRGAGGLAEATEEGLDDLVARIGAIRARKGASLFSDIADVAFYAQEPPSSRTIIDGGEPDVSRGISSGRTPVRNVDVTEHT